MLVDLVDLEALQKPYSVADFAELLVDKDQDWVSFYVNFCIFYTRPSRPLVVPSGATGVLWTGRELCSRAWYMSIIPNTRPLSRYPRVR